MASTTRGYDRFLNFFVLFVTFYMLMVFQQPVASRIDLLGFYGVIPSIGLTLMSFGVEKLPSSFPKYGLYATALFGVYQVVTLLKFIAFDSGYENYVGDTLKAMYNGGRDPKNPEHGYPGYGAMGVFIDQMSIGWVALAHILVESFRRKSSVNYWTTLWALGSWLFPGVYYPLYLANTLPSGRDKHGSDAKGTRSIGTASAMWVYWIVAFLNWWIWAPPTMMMFINGNGRWYPDNFKKWGVGGTPPAQYCTMVVLGGLLTALFHGLHRIDVRVSGVKLKCSTAFLFNFLVRTAVCMILFVTVGSSLAAILALTFIDSSETAAVAYESGSTKKKAASGTAKATTTARGRATTATPRRKAAASRSRSRGRN